MARNFKARKGISRNYTLLARQKEFPKLTCKKNLPTPDTKDSDNPNDVKYILKENDTQCAIFSTELRFLSPRKRNSDAMIISKKVRKDATNAQSNPYKSFLLKSI